MADDLEYQRAGSDTEAPSAALCSVRWPQAALLLLACSLSSCLTFLATRAGAPAAAETLTAQAGAAPLEKDTLGGPGSPRAKQVVLGMDSNVNLHVAWDDWKDWSKNMAPYWTEDFIYDFNYVGPWNFSATRGLRAWFLGEHMHFNRAIPDSQWQDFIRAARGPRVTSATYGLARWSGEFAGVPPPANGPIVRIRDLDFYLLEGDRIKINWCLVDVIHLFEQVGYHVLPPSPMKTDGYGYRAPHAMDGLTAPLSLLFTEQDALASEEVWKAALRDDYDRPGPASARWADNLTWYGPAGIGTATSRKEYEKHWLAPLKAAFSNLTRETDLLVCEGPYCGAHFYLWGDHTGPWLGEAPTGKRIPIRCGAHAHVVDGKITEGWMIIDIPRAFQAMGVDLYGRARRFALAQRDAEQS